MTAGMASGTTACPASASGAAAQPALRAGIRHGKSMLNRGRGHASAGNSRVRLQHSGGFLTTPTDACLGPRQPAQLAWVGTDGTQHAGGRASKTLALHRQIYAAAPEAHCVIHSHSTRLVALALAGVWQPDAVWPPITP